MASTLSHIYGLWGEALVVFYLRILGFSIDHRRFRSPLGEIDIIARRGEWLRFIEVKARFSHRDLLYEACKAGQLARIRRAAEWYLAKKPFCGQISIDVFYVYRAFGIKSISNVQ